MQMCQALDPLELESQMIVKHHVGDGNWTQIPATAMALNLWAISTAPLSLVF